MKWAEEMEEARDEFSGGWVRAGSSYVQGWVSTAATGVATCRVIKQGEWKDDFSVLSSSSGWGPGICSNLSGVSAQPTHQAACSWAFTCFQITGLLVFPTYLAFYFCLLVFQRSPGSSVSSVRLLVDSSEVILPFGGLYVVAMAVRLG